MRDAFSKIWFLQFHWSIWSTLILLTKFSWYYETKRVSNKFTKMTICRCLVVSHADKKKRAIKIRNIFVLRYYFHTRSKFVTRFQFRREVTHFALFCLQYFLPCTLRSSTTNSLQWFPFWLLFGMKIHSHRNENTQTGCSHFGKAKAQKTVNKPGQTLDAFLIARFATTHRCTLSSYFSLTRYVM